MFETIKSVTDLNGPYEPFRIFVVEFRLHVATLNLKNLWHSSASTHTKLQEKTFQMLHHGVGRTVFKCAEIIVSFSHSTTNFSNCMTMTSDSINSELLLGIRIHMNYIEWDSLIEKRPFNIGLNQILMKIQMKIWIKTKREQKKRKIKQTKKFIHINSIYFTLFHFLFSILDACVCVLLFYFYINL